MKTGRASNKFRGLAALLSVLLVVAICLTMLCFEWSGQVNMVLKVEIPTQTTEEGSICYPTAYTEDGALSAEGLQAMLTASDEHDVQTMREGAVLVKNESNALPLTESERSVSLFGRATADPVYRCSSGGAKATGERLVSLYDALSDAGFSLNDTLFNAYSASGVTRVVAAVESGEVSSIGEVDVSFYDGYKSTWTDSYNDAAIVMFAREGGEGKDLFACDADGISQLALHDQEAELLRMLKAEKDNGVFDKIIVLINSPYAMELGWVEDPQYGLDAALWIGGTGLKGFTGVADLLTGEADPSGRFVDTYAANSLSSPAAANSGDFSFENADYSYIVEAEGIYTGYKYYETRYQDQVMGRNNADAESGSSFAGGWDYAAEMDYTFGYGLSYARFEQTLDSVEWDWDSHTVTAQVTVTNLGPEEGSAYTGASQSVVELYAQLPWEVGQAEKSAVQLVGFGKTDLLSPGESETVTITVDDYLFATYDENAVNGADPSKTGCYVFDAGDYYFAIGSDAHDALNNILARQGVTGLFDAEGNQVTGNAEQSSEAVTLTALDNVTYATSRFGDEVVSNCLEDADINYFLPDTVTYLIRSDWTTFPEPVTGLTATDEMLTQLQGGVYEKSADSSTLYETITQGADSGISFIEMKDVPYTGTYVDEDGAEHDADAEWETFLNQLTISDLCSIIGENFGQAAITSVVKPENRNTDGPAGSQNNYLAAYGGGEATCHVNEVVAASTWNAKLLAERGAFIAEDALYSGTTQMWSPGADLHRTPFSGRNFEYYSEDSIMTYLYGAIQCAAMQEKGLNASIKHFCGNDQETNRMGLAIFTTEQSFRQGSLKGFEGAFTDGGALATMMSCSRIGCRIFYQSSAILKQILREEWHWAGQALTDAVRGATEVDTFDALMAGTDAFNNGEDRGSAVKTYLVSQKDGDMLVQLRLAAKRYFYAMVNSNLVNGLALDTTLTNFTPWWQIVLIVLDVALGIAAAACIVLFLMKTYKKGGENHARVSE